MKNKNKNQLELLEYIGMFLVITAICFLSLIYIGQRIVVNGNSMYPTLEDTQNLVLNKISYKVGDPERFDIIAFYSPNTQDKYLIKRIIALPNESVCIDTDTNKIYIKKAGEDVFLFLNEDYGYEPMENAGRASEIITLGEDEYFVLGDNRNNSIDSRFEEVGNVNRSHIFGKAVFRFSPLKKIGFLS